MIKLNTITIMALTGMVGYGFYHQHQKIEDLIQTNKLTHDSLQLETHNRRKMGDQMMALQTQYQENAVALDAVQNTKNQLAKVSTWTENLTKPIHVWHGGGNCPHYTSNGNGFTLDQCNQKCLDTKWCTHFYLAYNASANCVSCADGAIRTAANQANFYKVVRPDTPVTTKQLTEFSNDLIGTLKDIVGEVGANQAAIATQAAKEDKSIKTLEKASHFHGKMIRENTEQFGAVKGEIKNDQEGISTLTSDVHTISDDQSQSSKKLDQLETGFKNIDSQFQSVKKQAIGQNYIVNDLAANQKELDEKVTHAAKTEKYIVRRFNHIKGEISDLKQKHEN